MMTRIVPVLLAGGAGTRLWPMSRTLHPTPFLTLGSGRSMLQEAATLVADPARFAPPIVIANHEHRFLVAEQLREAGVTPAAILLEPEDRNSAASCTAGALHAAAADPDSRVTVMPITRSIRDRAGFLDAVDQAAAVPGQMARLRLPPSKHPGAEHAGGVFVFHTRTLTDMLDRCVPTLPRAIRGALDGGQADLDFFRLEARAFATAPVMSIEQALTETRGDMVAIPCDPDCTDTGSWDALWETSPKDSNGNVAVGDVMTMETRNCFIHGGGRLVAVAGLDGVTVVATDDAVLVAARDRADDVEALVERLQRDGRSEAVLPRRVHRPWGSFQSVLAGERFQVKLLTVKPGARLSLQKHHHRAEHWVVVQGTALVTRNEELMLVYENQSVYLPLGAVHRLENPGKLPLHIIEVQSGSYLGEDDIVRLEDTYGRA